MASPFSYSCFFSQKLVIVPKGAPTSCSRRPPCGRDPGDRLPWQYTLLPHDVDLLERQTLGLRNTEEHVEPCKAQTTNKHVPVVEVDGIGDERREESQQETPDPIGRDR